MQKYSTFSFAKSAEAEKPSDNFLSFSPKVSHKESSEVLALAAHILKNHLNYLKAGH